TYPGQHGQVRQSWSCFIFQVHYTSLEPRPSPRGSEPPTIGLGSNTLTNDDARPDVRRANFRRLHPAVPRQNSLGRVKYLYGTTPRQGLSIPPAWKSPGRAANGPASSNLGAGGKSRLSPLAAGCPSVNAGLADPH